MGIIVNVNEDKYNKLKTLAEDGLFNIGLIIAQRSCDQTYVTHLIPLPSQEAEEHNDTEGDKPIGNKKETSPISRPTSVIDVATSTVGTHAQQVVRMVPGGLDIEGLYVITSTSELNNPATQGKLRSILGAMHKVTSKYYLGTAESSLEKIVVFGCTQTLKVGAKSIDLSEHGTSLVSVSLKMQDVNWLQLRFKYMLSYPVYLPKDKNSSLRKVVLNAFQPWAETLENSVILIDGEDYKEEQELDATENISKKKSSKSATSEKIVKVFEADILDAKNHVSFNKFGFEECHGTISFHGTLSGMAFVNGKATAAEGKKAVRRDLIRSLVAKWEMHCDSLVEEPQGVSSVPVLHEPPKRVFLEDENSPIVLCDYLFPGDFISDACHSAKEILGLTIKEENVDDSHEQFAEPEEFSSPESLASFEDNKRITEILEVNRTHHVFYTFLTVFIAIAFTYCVGLFMKRS